MKNKTRSYIAIFVGVIFTLALWAVPAYILGLTKGLLFVIAYTVFVFCVGTLSKNISKDDEK